MKLAVVCANGKAGRLITDEAVKRGLDVTVIIRGENKTAANKVITKDILDIKPEDLKGFDAVIDTFGAWTPDTLPMHSTSLKALCDAVSGTNTRLLVVGGAGSLYVNPEHTMTLSQTPDFPESWQPLANAMAKALAELRERKDVKWTYISPAADFQADGAKTGKYILAGEDFTLNANKQSYISYADYAAAMIDEAVNGNHVNQRISVLAE
ncbi:MAG: NAD(P)-dependent oxidoreductase [Synergistaceae bacterium]|nr:NAD(P)-dependent oxidoreductase [Synergistaceae bacterium]